MNGYKNLKIKKTEQVVMTPDIANIYLSKNNANRRISNLTVNQYARQMQLGNWKLTHQGIAVDEHGNIVDGQHRLLAIVKSNTNIPMTVTTYEGKVTALMIPLDVGKKRSNKDITGISNGRLAMFNSIGYLFNKRSVTPVVSVELNKRLNNYIETLQHKTKISIDGNTNKGNGLLYSIWSGSTKTALLAYIIEGMDIKNVYNADNDMFLNNSCNNFVDYKNSLIGIGGGTNYNITMTALFYAAIHDDISATSEDYDLIDDYKRKLRKIFSSEIEDLIVMI